MLKDIKPFTYITINKSEKTIIALGLEKVRVKTFQIAKEKLNMQGNNNQNVTVNQNAQVNPQEPQAQKTDVQGQATEPQAQATEPQTQQVAEPSAEPSLADLMKTVAELKVDNRKLKKANDSLASENGDLRKQVNAKLTEEELRAQTKAEKEEETSKRIAELEAKVALNDATKSYMSMGMPEELAQKVAQADVDGDKELVNASIKAFMEAQAKAIEEKVKAEIYAKMPVPVSGNGDGQIDYNKIYQEKLEAGDMQGAIHAQLMGAQQKAQ